MRIFGPRWAESNQSPMETRPSCGLTPPHAPSPMTPLILIGISCPDADTARRIGAVLIDRRLAACVHVGAPFRSRYRWQGAVEEAEEVPSPPSPAPSSSRPRPRRPGRCIPTRPRGSSPCRWPPPPPTTPPGSGPRPKAPEAARLTRSQDFFHDPFGLVDEI